MSIGLSPAHVGVVLPALARANNVVAPLSSFALGAPANVTQRRSARAAAVVGDTSAPLGSPRLAQLAPRIKRGAATLRRTARSVAVATARRV